MIRNTCRDSKIKEVDKLRKKFEAQDCDRVEQLNGVLLELEEKVNRTNDITQRASTNELVPSFEPMYAHEKYGMVAMNTTIAQARRTNEKEHTRLKIYKLPYDEIAADGKTITRFYVTVLQGKKEVKIVNDKLDLVKAGLDRIITGNEQAADVKAVRAERKAYIEYLRNKRKIDSS